MIVDPFVLSQESEKFVKLYILELKKALKDRRTGVLTNCVRADNFLSLIQVICG